MRVKLLIALAIGGLVFPAAALADTAESSNWAGYAAHRNGVSFRSVFAKWTEPRIKCTRGKRSYSSFWVGLGGFSANSQALEQVGTEADCRVSGKAVTSAWYELVPQPSIPVKLIVRPGDVVQGQVTVVGNSVDAKLTDLTRHHSFHKTLHASIVDASSADWIVEAPSLCVSLTSCQTLPLANFGSATFDLARAVSVSGQSGSITSPAWHWTKIQLTPSGRHFVVYRGSGNSAGAASPSALRSNGTSFKVTYARVKAPPSPFFTSRDLLLEGQLYH